MPITKPVRPSRQGAAPSSRRALDAAPLSLAPPDPPRDEPAAPPASIPTREPTEHELLEALLSPEASLDALARRHALTLRGLIAWAERRDVARLRASMRRLADERADLIASRARVVAAHRLGALAADDADGAKETSRKACVDLLRFRCSGAPDQGEARPAAETQDDPESDRAEEAAFLEELAREAARAEPARPDAITADPDRTDCEAAD